MYQGVIDAFESGLDGSFTGGGVALNGSAHVNGDSAGDVGLFKVCGLAQVDNGVTVRAENGLGLIGGHVLHFDVLGGEGLDASHGKETHEHGEGQQQGQCSFHFDFYPPE